MNIKCNYNSLFFFNKAMIRGCGVNKPSLFTSQIHCVMLHLNVYSVFH